MPRVNDMKKIDAVKAKAILFENKTTGAMIAEEIGKNRSFIDTCFNRGQMRESTMLLIKKVCNIDLTPCIIEESKQIEMPLNDVVDSNDICNVISEFSDLHRKQSAVNTAMIVDAIKDLTNAINDLNNNLNANYDNQYKLVDTIRMKVDKIRKIQ